MKPKSIPTPPLPAIPSPEVLAAERKQTRAMMELAWDRSDKLMTTLPTGTSAKRKRRVAKMLKLSHQLRALQLEDLEDV